MCSVGAGVQLTPNSNAWSTISDWTTKKSVTLLDCDRVLAGLAQLPLYEYEYRSTKNGHKNFGPMAQDWAALMPVTETQVGSVVSMDVMALAATKALHAQVTAQAAAIAELQAALASLQAALAALRPGSA